MTAPDSLRLLHHLRTLDAAGISRLLHRRQVPLRSIAEPMDLADWLCRHDAVTDALRRLPLSTIVDLREQKPEASSLAAELALATRDNGDLTLLTVTETALAELLPCIPFAADIPTTTDDAAGTLTAFETTQLAADLCWEISHRALPVREDRRGIRIRSADLRRLAPQFPDADPTLVVQLGQLLGRAQLLAPLEDSWALTDAGEQFLQASQDERWSRLAQHWYDELDPSALLSADTSGLPLGEALGITVHTEERLLCTAMGANLLSGDVTEAQRIAAAQFPAPVAQVYLQPDCTVIAPGPLRGADDIVVRELAELEQRALASQFRLTEHSIMTAFRAGWNAESITTALEERSLTGIPQPVQYLINRCNERFGTVRVRKVAGHTQIRVENEKVHDAIRIDTSLAVLSLAEHKLANGERVFTTRIGSTTALAALIQGRYPAVLEDVQGQIITSRLPRARAQAKEPVSEQAVELAEELATALRGTAPDDHNTWVRRALELARRSKSWVEIDVEVPGQDAVELLLLPLAVTDQRVRARDGDADVERTIPLRSICSVRELSVEE